MCRVSGSCCEYRSSSEKFAQCSHSADTNSCSAGTPIYADPRTKLGNIGGFLRCASADGTLCRSIREVRPFLGLLGKRGTDDRLTFLFGLIRPCRNSPASMSGTPSRERAEELWWLNQTAENRGIDGQAATPRVSTCIRVSEFLFRISTSQNSPGVFCFGRDPYLLTDLHCLYTFQNSKKGTYNENS